LIKGVINLPF